MSSLNMRLTIRYIHGCSKILVFGVFIILCMCDKNESFVGPVRLRECVFSFSRLNVPLSPINNEPPHVIVVLIL